MPEIKVSSTTALNLVLRNEDGTPATSITFATGDLRVKKPGGSWANAAGSAPTHTEDGVWTYTPTTDETDTAGELLVKFDKSSYALHVRAVDVVTLLRGEPQTLATGAITAAVIATGAIDADAVASDAVTEIQSGLATAAALATVDSIVDAIAATVATNLDAAVSTRATPAQVAAGSVASVTGSVASVTAGVTLADAAITAAKIGADAITAAKVASDVGTEIAAAVDSTLTTAHGSGSWQEGSSGGATASEIADAVLDEAVSGHATSGTVGAALSTLLTGVAALPSASAVASAVLAATLEGAHTVAGGLRLLLAVGLGRRTISGTTQTFRDLGNTKSRVVATVDSDGNRAVASTADGT